LTVASLDSILPVVLVGGKSRRFGRDKLLEPRPHRSLLVDIPIAALRAVFGPRVAACGRCNPEVSARADFLIDDIDPGAGPLGGIVSALTEAKAKGMDWVFAMAGDLPGVSQDTVLAMLTAQKNAPEAAIVAAQTDRLQPCIALYHLRALDRLLAAASIQAERAPSLAGIVSSFGGELVTCPIDPKWAANANTPDQLAAFDWGV
jgi:molybdopterin-guanine dinucleotide biosynthesis protein A